MPKRPGSFKHVRRNSEQWRLVTGVREGAAADHCSVRRKGRQSRGQSRAIVHPYPESGADANAAPRPFTPAVSESWSRVRR